MPLVGSTTYGKTKIANANRAKTLDKTGMAIWDGMHGGNQQAFQRHQIRRKITQRGSFK